MHRIAKGQNVRIHSRSPVSRRSILLAGAGLALSRAIPPLPVRASQGGEYKLVAKPGRVALVGEGQRQTAVWAYDGKVPGPTLRLRQGEPARIIVENRLNEDTTVHCHGIRLPNAMDGVPGLTQKPIKPGESFTYEFTPPDAGTFWYHPHADSLRQLGRGLAGVLIIEEREPVAVDRDVLWVLTDWRLTSDAQIASGFGNGMDAGMAGRIGNTVTLNGAISTDERVHAGERVRLRLVNTSLARIMALRFEGHRPLVVALDGQPCDPHEPESGRILFGPAMRVDVILDIQGEPGHRYRIIDDFYQGRSYWLTQLAYEQKDPIRISPLDAPLALPANPLPQPDLASAERHELRLQGGMMGGGMMGGGMMGGMGMSGMSHRAVWAINGQSMTGDGHAGMPPLLTLRRGQSIVLAIVNETAWWHPMHLHGHSFRILKRNGTSIPHNLWGDTVLVPPKETVEVAFVADNPGDWMIHCHITDHQVSGLMAVIRIA
jgi:FtsP/CotA-like multicopper oxidase with cupredoxin domain